MTLEIRPITSEEVETYAGRLNRVFAGNGARPAHVGWLRRTLELDRTLAGFEGGEMVATAGIISLRMTVPGRVTAACAGVTRVSVLPTHRRRGTLRALMRRQLDDVRERGEPLAALYASQAPIYGRFGYGIGTWHADVAIEHARARLRVAEPGLAVRLVDREQAVQVAAGLHEQVAERHPGAVHRPPEHWEGRFADLPEQRAGASELNHVVIEGDGGATGFASYRLRRRGSPAVSIGTVQVRDLLSTTTAANIALWRYLTGIELVHRVAADSRPVQEPVRLALADPRAFTTSVGDGLWLRLVDVPAALAARRYAAAGRLVLRVHDEFCPWNEGTYELAVGAGGEAECRPAQAEPDLELTAADLASAYLGANPFARLAESGLVAGAPAAVARADALFRTDDLPWCPTHF